MCNQRETTLQNSSSDYQKGDIVPIKKWVGISSALPHQNAYFVYPGKILGVAGDYAVVARSVGEPIAVAIDDLREWAQEPFTNREALLNLAL